MRTYFFLVLSVFMHLKGMFFQQERPPPFSVLVSSSKQDFGNFENWFLQSGIPFGGARLSFRGCNLFSEDAPVFAALFFGEKGVRFGSIFFTKGIRCGPSFCHEKGFNVAFFFNGIHSGVVFQQRLTSSILACFLASKMAKVQRSSNGKWHQVTYLGSIQI